MKESPLYRMEMTKVKHLLKKQIQRCFCVICEGPGLRTQEHLFSRFLFVSDVENLAIILKGKNSPPSLKPEALRVACRPICLTYTSFIHYVSACLVHITCHCLTRTFAY